MPFTEEDLAQLGAFVKQQVAEAVGQATAPAPPPADAPDVAATKEAQPVYYVHLADGRVLETQDSQSTVIDGLAVIARFPKDQPVGGVA